MSNKIKRVNIKNIKEKLNRVRVEIGVEEFVPYFESLQDQYEAGFSYSAPAVRVEKISELKDLERIPAMPGVYLIFTDYSCEGTKNNPCTLSLKSDPMVRVIYRGESYKVRNRLESHLFYDTYHQVLKKQAGRVDNYTVCLKLDSCHVNLDQESNVSKAAWYVAYHGLPESDQVIREIAEQAFDRVYHRPVCSFK